MNNPKLKYLSVICCGILMIASFVSYMFLKPSWDISTRVDSIEQIKQNYLIQNLYRDSVSTFLNSNPNLFEIKNNSLLIYKRSALYHIIELKLEAYQRKPKALSAIGVLKSLDRLPQAIDQGFMISIESESNNHDFISIPAWIFYEVTTEIKADGIINTTPVNPTESTNNSDFIL